ncbi:AbgT family transporter [Pseudogracilibacillus sp. SO30301A]|uniref:AbgT family transporter n=1 Tax=Pseudogracilibacillus sp. SO30301A TaxID=3098291 RepID=UPI00300DBF86
MAKNLKVEDGKVLEPKKKFKMPHLLWIMLGLLLIASLATYVIPAGNFAVDQDGNVLGDQFKFIGHQTPVSPWDMLMYIMDGLNQSSMIIFLVLAAGASISVLLASGAIDNILNWSIYKLQDKGLPVLVSAMFILVVYIGGFAGSDALIALVPIGVIFARKLKLDPIIAIGITTFPALIGFGTGPQTQLIPQMMIGITPYSGFGLRFLFMNIFMILGLIYLMRYIKKIQKDESKSLMYSEGWRSNLTGQANVGEGGIKEEKLQVTSILALVSFITQYLVIVGYSTMGGDLNQLYNFIIVINIITAIVIGLLTQMSFDKIGDSFAKGLASMAFIAFIIGLARVMSIILTEGNILDSIVFYMTKPLMEINRSFATVGMSFIISILNPLIPSATSKAAILIPIIEPIAETLHLPKQVAIQAFQFGDGFTNMISPVLGWTVGSCVAAGVTFTKWVRWVLPAVIIFMLVGFVILVILTSIGWTGGSV